MTPKVSVIIPVYNCEPYIGKAIESVLAQSEQNFEIVVVDDASTDKTVEIVRSFNDQRIRLFHNVKNSGPSYSRNRAIAESRGEWVALLDADDWYAPERLEVLLRHAQQSSADIIADDIYTIIENNNIPLKRHFSSHGIHFTTPRSLDLETFINEDHGLLKPIISRCFIENHGIKYMEQIRYGEDFLFVVNCLLAGALYSILPSAYYFRRIRKESLTSNELDLYSQIQNCTESLLTNEQIISSPAIIDALKNRLYIVRENIIYNQVVKPIKQRNFKTAFSLLLYHPQVFMLFIKRLPKILNYRLAILKDRMVNLWKK